MLQIKLRIGASETFYRTIFDFQIDCPYEFGCKQDLGEAVYRKG